jgi:hypothetical protein
MTTHNPMRDDIYNRLQEAIDGLRKDLLRVEIWASALHGFSQPVPSYQPDSRFLLPPRSRKGG